MKRIYAFAAGAACLLPFVAACTSTHAQTPPPPAAPSSAPADSPPQPVTERGTVRLIQLPEAEADMPPGKGREAVVTYCAMCHTPGYIMLQPPLSRETWTAQVAKMRTVYSGPIPEEKVPEIIEYLVAANGAPSAPK